MAFREKMKTNWEEKNEVKKMNEAKMEKNEVKPTGAEAMVMDEKLTVTDQVATELEEVMQLTAAGGTMASAWTIRLMAGSDGDAAVTEVSQHAATTTTVAVGDVQERDQIGAVYDSGGCGDGIPPKGCRAKGCRAKGCPNQRLPNQDCQTELWP